MHVNARACVYAPVYVRLRLCVSPFVFACFRVAIILRVYAFLCLCVQRNANGNMNCLLIKKKYGVHSTSSLLYKNKVIVSREVSL